MRQYPVKKGVKTDVDAVLGTCMKYSKDSTSKGNTVELSLPGLKSVRILCGNKNIHVETESDTSYSDLQESIRVYNQFITELTGFDSSERKKRVTKK